MIKRIGITLVLMLSLVPVSLAEEAKEIKENKTAVETNAPEKTKLDIEGENRIKEAAKELENTLWRINLKQITQSEKKEAFADVIRFKAGKVEMESLTSQGFSPTSYSVTVKGETYNIVVWETMQTSEKKGLAFWKGEIEEGRMRGVLSRHLDGKTVKDYSFYSTAKEMIQEEAPIAAAPTAKASDIKAPPLAKEEKKEASEERTKKKKKGN
jgi:hypothetical protein